MEGRKREGRDKEGMGREGGLMDGWIEDIREGGMGGEREGRREG